MFMETASQSYCETVGSSCFPDVRNRGCLRSTTIHRRQLTSKEEKRNKVCCRLRGTDWTELPRMPWWRGMVCLAGWPVVTAVVTRLWSGC